MNRILILPLSLFVPIVCIYYVTAGLKLQDDFFAFPLVQNICIRCYSYSMSNHLCLFCTAKKEYYYGYPLPLVESCN